MPKPSPWGKQQYPSNLGNPNKLEVHIVTDKTPYRCLICGEELYMEERMPIYHCKRCRIEYWPNERLAEDEKMPIGVYVQYLPEEVIWAPDEFAREAPEYMKKI